MTATTTHPDRPIQPDGRLHGAIVACRRGDGKWLLIRRSANVAAPLKICFPGGAIELDESPRDAAQREMREELGLEIEPVKQVWRHEVPERSLVLFGWLGRFVDRDPTPRPDAHEVAEAIWMTDAEILACDDAMPNTDQFVRAIRDAINEA